MGRLLGKNWVLGSCCVAALLTAAGCQTGTGTRSQRPLAKGGMTPGAFTSKDALAAQKRSGGQPMVGSPTPLIGANQGQFPGPTGFQPAAGPSMGMPPLGNTSGLSSAGPGPNTFGGMPASGVMQTGYSQQLPSTGALPPPGTDLPRNPSLSPSPGSTTGTPGTTSRDTIAPPPGAFAPPGAFDMPAPVPPTPSYNNFPSR